MRKGMIFSIDAAIALAIVIVLAGSVAVYYEALSEKSHFLGSLHSRAADRAVLGFYSGTSASETIPGSADFGNCVVMYTIDLENGKLGSRETPIKSTFCEESG